MRGPAPRGLGGRRAGPPHAGRVRGAGQRNLYNLQYQRLSFDRVSSRRSGDKEQDAFSSYLKERYEDQIGWYNRKAAHNQTVYRWMQWTLIALAAVTPILIELDLKPLGYVEGSGSAGGIVQWATLTSAIVAILTAGLKTFKYQENWINYRTTCETLRKEIHYYDAGVGEYADAPDREALFVDRVESLISRENTMWVSAHKAESRTAKAGPGPTG